MSSVSVFQSFTSKMESWLPKGSIGILCSTHSKRVAVCVCSALSVINTSFYGRFATVLSRLVLLNAVIFVIVCLCRKYIKFEKTVVEKPLKMIEEVLVFTLPILSLMSAIVFLSCSFCIGNISFLLISAFVFLFRLKDMYRFVLERYVDLKFFFENLNKDKDREVLRLIAKSNESKLNLYKLDDKSSMLFLCSIIFLHLFLLLILVFRK